MSGDHSGIVAVAFMALQAGVVVLILILFYRMNRLEKQKNALLQAKEIVFNFMYDIGEVFVESDSVDLAALQKKVINYALRTTSAGAGALYLLEPDDETLRAVAVTGIFPPITGELGQGIDAAFSKIRYVERLVQRQTVRIGQGLIGEVAALGAPILVEDAETDRRIPHFEQDFLKINSILIIPMRFHHRVMGVLAVTNRVDGQPFSRDDQDLLQALADQASVSIHYANFSAALDEKRRLDYDLSIAKRIQTALLPKEVPRIEGVELGAFSVPAQQIGGDYYDFVDVDDTHMGIVIADVSGKGVSGAIIMSVCRSVLRVVAPGCLSPFAVLSEVNRILSPDMSEDMFVSLLYMILDVRTHELVVARAGHVFPILNSGIGEPWTIQSKGMAMGLGNTEVFDEALDEKSVWLKPGDMVVAYTDGVIEARDRNEDEWGILNLMKTIQTTAFEGEGAPSVAANVHQKLLQFVGDTPQYDDMTLVAIRTIK